MVIAENVIKYISALSQWSKDDIRLLLLSILLRQLSIKQIVISSGLICGII